MKTTTHHIMAQKDLRCRFRNFELDHGAIVFLNHASTPMLEWLQEVHINDSEALVGDVDLLMKIATPLTKPKVTKRQFKRQQRIKKKLYQSMRPKPND